MLGSAEWSKVWGIAFESIKYGDAFYVNQLSYGVISYGTGVIVIPRVELRTGACLRFIDRATKDGDGRSIVLRMLPDSEYSGTFYRDVVSANIFPICIKAYFSLQLARRLTSAARDRVIQYRIVTGRRPSAIIYRLGP